MSEDNILMIIGWTLIAIAGVVLSIGVYVACNIKSNAKVKTLRGQFWSFFLFLLNFIFNDFC